MRRLRQIALPMAAFLVCAWLAASVEAQWTERVSVRHAAFSLPDAPSALVHAPAGFQPSAPLRLVVFLHGYMGCAEVLMRAGAVSCKPGGEPLTGWDLEKAHDAAGVSTLFIIPQLAFMKRNGKPGCFGRSGCFRAFLDEVLRALPPERLKKSLDDVKGVTLVAHSAGYRAAQAVLEHGGTEKLIDEVVLFDALYCEPNGFLDWVAGRDPRRRLLSLHIGAGKPAEHSAQLFRRARRRLGAEGVARLDDDIDRPTLGAALRAKRLAIARVGVPHRQVPEAYLGRVLKALADSR